MLELFPEGFEESDFGDRVTLSAYTDARGEGRLSARFGGVVTSDVPTDWAERWKQFHRPVRAGGLWIVPPWEQAPSGGDSIRIDPGRAFGTGAHPTTRLCLDVIAELEPGSLLDVGCGSGVLAIGAAKLGFAPVVAIDSDRHAVDAARANAAVNGVDVQFRNEDATGAALPRADIAVANISAELVDVVGERLDCSLFVTSGYFEHHVPRLARFRAVARRTLDGWAADLHSRQ